MNNTSDNTRVLVVDDHEVVIAGITAAIGAKKGFEVVGIACDGLEALKLVSELKPEIVIMDIAMPRQNGVQTTQILQKQFPETRVIIYTMFGDEEYLIELFKLGISGYVLKQEPFSRLMGALDAVKAGGSYFNADTPLTITNYIESVEEADHSESVMSALSPREKEVFIHLADGMPVKKIAAELSISPKTVEAHKYNIMEKLGIKTTTEMTKIAIRLELIGL